MKTVRSVPARRAKSAPASFWTGPSIDSLHDEVERWFQVGLLKILFGEQSLNSGDEYRRTRWRIIQKVRSIPLELAIE